MTGHHSLHGHASDDDSERPGRPLPTPSNVVDLGTHVGAEPSTGLPPTGPDTSQPPPHERDEWEIVDETGCGSPGDSRRQPRASGPRAPEVGEYAARTYRSGDALAVVAELSGVSEEALSIGINVRSNQLVVSVEGRTVDRVPLPWPSTVVTGVRFEDGVLEARLEPDEDGGFGADQEGYA